jgi:pimeloyl-ACP methyl ester carboxylesterase
MPDASSSAASGGGPRPEPFTPETDPAALADLRARLRATRWPDAPEDAGWSLGTDLAYLRELVGYWADGFDWPAQEAALARLPRFRVSLGGARIHFVHVRAAGPVLPLVLSHGWPDSSWRYAKVIGLLTDPGAHGADPADAFDVVVPDMPGYGYSGRPAGPPLDSIAVAGLWAELMGVLGYRRFGAAGGDIGSHVSRYLALDHPDRVVAVHRTDAGVPVFAGDPADLAPEERAWFEEVAAWGAAEGAYAAMHRTKPQTAAFGLTDSPAGLAAWITEKLRAWLERTANVVRVTEPARGGHFAPFEEPELYAEELRAFFRPYRAAATG